MNREPIYAAAAAFFAGLTTGNAPLFKTATRQLTTWESVSPDDQPALLFRERTERSEKKKGFPTKWFFGVELFLYVHTGANNDPTVVPSQMMSPLLDAIEAALAPDNIADFSCTLGGLVSHCEINGVIERFHGNLGDEAVAVIPIEILVIG